jgi:hypothetical protein
MVLEPFALGWATPVTTKVCLNRDATNTRKSQSTIVFLKNLNSSDFEKMSQFYATCNVITILSRVFSWPYPKPNEFALPLLALFLYDLRIVLLPSHLLLAFINVSFFQVILLKCSLERGGMVYALFVFWLIYGAGWSGTKSIVTAATYWPILLALGDRRWWLWNNNEINEWQRKAKHSEKTSPNAALSTDPTWLDQDSNPATSQMSYDTASLLLYVKVYFSFRGVIWLWKRNVAFLP